MSIPTKNTQTHKTKLVITTDPAPNQTATQTDVHPDIQPDGSSTNPSARPSDSHAVAQPASQSVEQTVIQPPHQTVTQSDGPSVSRSEAQMVGQTVLSPISQTVGQPEAYHYPTVDLMMFSDPVIGLTRNQCLVLLFVIHQPGITQRPAISEHTGVPFGTVKDALAVLVKKSFISKPKYFVNGDYRGFSYVTNRALCDDFLRKRGSEFNQMVTRPVSHPAHQTAFQTVARPVSILDSCSDSQTVSQTGPFSSKVFKDENLTTSKPGLLHEPELRFWAGEGVTERQVANWMSEFQLSKEEIVLSLRYGRFDILERGDVQNSANWFYKILTRNGFYPKPANYRSMLEIRAEALKQQQERDREARAQVEAGEFERRFKEFIANPESPLYQDLLGQVNSFAKERLKEGDSHTFEIEMRELFKKTDNLHRL